MIRYLNRLLRRSRDIGADEYEQLSILQRTNMSEVWLARRKADRLITVTKIARVDKPKYAKANQKAISNEARWLNQLQGSPRIIQIYRTGETTLKGKPRFIAAEYLAGGTVEDLLDQESIIGRINRVLLILLTFGRRPRDKNDRPNLLRFIGISDRRLYRGPLSVEQALLIVRYIAEGLAHMHSQNIVHRDIKPDNIMFRYRPRHGQPVTNENLVLIDFGIAAAHNRRAGAAIARGWSEQRRVLARKERKPIIVHSGFDIYCLGKVLRYLLTRTKPLDSDEAEQSKPLDWKTIQFPKYLSTDERIDIANSLSILMGDCLHADVEMRPSAREVIMATEQMLGTALHSPRLLRGSLSRPDELISREALEQNLSVTANAPKYRFFRLGYLGTVAIIIIGIAISTWMWQYGANALANMTTPIAAIINPPKVDSIITTNEKPFQLDESDSTSSADHAISSISAPSIAVRPKAATVSEDSIPNANINGTTEPPEEATAFSTSTALVSTPLPNLIPTREELPVLQSTATDTNVPTVEPSPTRKSRPTNTPMTNASNQGALSSTQSSSGQDGTIDSQTLASRNGTSLSPLSEIRAIIGPHANGCNSESSDTWDERVELKWRLEPAGITLPSGYAQEVVVWRPGADPLDLNQAYTIHGRTDILVSEGNYILQRKPRSLIPTVIERNEELIWGILLVNSASGARYSRLTPDDCRFHPAGRLFGDGQDKHAGGGQ